MAHAAQAAQAGGQDFQGRIFWHYAADLRRNPAAVKKVCYEYDAAAGVDDVVVFYSRPQIDESGKYDVDAIQAKYHVDQREAYSLSSLIEKRGRASASLLHKMYAGYRNLRNDGYQCRAILETNWGWDSADPVARKLKADGRLPADFGESKPASVLGKLWELWKSDLQISAEDLAEFVRDLRLYLSAPAISLQISHLSARLEAAGLEPIPGHKRANPYDSIFRRLLQAGKPIEMDLPLLEEICRDDDLLRTENPPSIDGQIGIRSFIRWGERMEVDCIDHVDVTEHFTRDRYVGTPEHWETVRTEVETFLHQANTAKNAGRVVLECHATLAFLAGRCLPSISGSSMVPVQKRAHHGPEPWRPECPLPTDLPGWTLQTEECKSSAKGVVVVLSVTHHINNDVAHYLEASSLSPRKIIRFCPQNGSAQASIQNASHAYFLASEVLRVIRKTKQHSEEVHIFLAAPNAFTFFLGQCITDLADPVQLYEHDRQRVEDTPYLPSLRFPPLKDRI